MKGDAIHSVMREIVGLLHRQADVCGRLLKLVHTERAAILSLRVSGMRALSLEKEMLLSRGRELEDRRMELVRRLAGLFELSPGQVTLATLAAFCDGDLAAELAECRSDLRQKVERLQEENQRSEALCRQGLAMLQGAFQVLKGMAAGEAVYQRTGRMEDARMSGRLMCGEF